MKPIQAHIHPVYILLGQGILLAPFVGGLCAVLGAGAWFGLALSCTIALGAMIAGRAHRFVTERQIAKGGACPDCGEALGHVVPVDVPAPRRTIAVLDGSEFLRLVRVLERMRAGIPDAAIDAEHFAARFLEREDVRAQASEIAEIEARS